MFFINHSKVSMSFSSHVSYLDIACMLYMFFCYFPFRVNTFNLIKGEIRYLTIRKVISYVSTRNGTGFNFYSGKNCSARISPLKLSLL